MGHWHCWWSWNIILRCHRRTWLRRHKGSRYSSLLKKKTPLSAYHRSKKNPSAYLDHSHILPGHSAVAHVLIVLLMRMNLLEHLVLRNAVRGDRRLRRLLRLLRHYLDRLRHLILMGRNWGRLLGHLLLGNDWRRVLRRLCGLTDYVAEYLENNRGFFLFKLPKNDQLNMLF